MRASFWKWFCANAIEHNLYFISCDLWRFEVPDDIRDRCIDLLTSEDLTWPVAAGLARNKARVFVYGVSFFCIGRLESLRSEIIHAGLDCYILNAGAHGYDKYGPSHAFYKEDDIQVMKAIGIKVIDSVFTNVTYIERSWNIFAEAETPKQQVIYLRLGKDIKEKL